MAFTYDLNNVDNKGSIGNFRYVEGDFTGDGGTGSGTIATQLSSVHFFWITPRGAAAQFDVPTVNQTFPTPDGNVEVFFSPNNSCRFIAIGR